MAVAVEPGPEPRLSKPVPLFEVSPEVPALGYDVMPDGQRFVMAKPGPRRMRPCSSWSCPGSSRR